MGKRNRNKFKQQNGEAAAPLTEVSNQTPTVPAKKDPWANIEQGTAKSAREVFYAPAVVEEFKEKHYEKMKNKKKRMNDGSAAERVDMHSAAPTKGMKRRNTENEPSAGKKNRVAEQEPVSSPENGSSTNVFASIVRPKDKKKVAELSKKKGKGKKLDDTICLDDEEEDDDDILEIPIEKMKAGQKSKKGGKKEKRQQSGGLDYIVEEPEDAVALKKSKSKKTFPKKDGGMCDLFDDEAMDGLESDEEMDDEEFENLIDAVYGMSSDEDEEEDVEDEEGVDVGDEDEDESMMDEMEENEVDADEMRLNPEDVDGVVESEEDSDMEDEEDMCDEDSGEEVSDEEEDEEQEEEGGCCNGDSTCCDDSASEQDAESDEEGNLGEMRPCGKVDQSMRQPPVDFTTFPFNDDDSAVTASRAFAWMINSCDVQSFFSDFHQQGALIVKRNNKNYYGNLFSSKKFVELLEKHYVEYGRNINIAEYKNSVRTTLNGEGRVFPNHIKQHLSLGRSVQLVNPQTFDDHIWYLCEVLQELFGCFVGANTYLTPAGSAGFAPHWDEIDAFIMQLEGRKYWKVYAPRDDDEELPRDSSGNFTEADMKDRTPTYEGWVEAGDMLYVPRGFIHQAFTAKNVHSLHVTVSTGRQWAFADLLEKLMPEAISALAESRLKMRRSLPIGLFDMGGVMDCEYTMEENFVERFKVPLDRNMAMLRNFVADHCMDSGVDLMAREFQKTALPPVLTPEEKRLSVIGSSVNVLSGTPTEFKPSTKIRFIRRHAQKLVFENEERGFITTRMNNARLYEGRPEQTIDFPLRWADAYSDLMNAYPEWMPLRELEVPKAERKEFCSILYDHGLIMVENGEKKQTKGKK